MHRTTKQNHVPQPRAEWEASGNITQYNSDRTMQSPAKMTGNKKASLIKTFHTIHLSSQPKSIHFRAHE